MDPNVLICPHCQNPVSIDEALKHQFDERYKKELEKEKELELEKEKEVMRAKMKEFLEKKEKEGEEEKRRLEEELKKRLGEEKELELRSMKEELDKSRELELKIRQEKNELEEQKRNFELDKQRQLDFEREKIRKITEEQILEKTRMEKAEKDKQIDDMRKKIEELQLKANLTSQQLQGEVLELELEQLLKTEFPFDQVLPVPKGMNGADVIQKVYDSTGKHCGTIIWESKRTKAWTEEWVQKLKDDLRASKADIALLVSSVLPKDIKKFGSYEGIFVTDFESLLGVTKLMRMKLIELCYAKLSVVGKDQKKEILWNYLTGNEFKQRVEAIVEAFNILRDDLEKEKQLYTKMWQKREKQIQRVIDNTLGMHGDLHGLMGASLPEIGSIEMTMVETLEEVDSKVKYTKETTISGDADMVQIAYEQVGIDDVVS